MKTEDSKHRRNPFIRVLECLFFTAFVLFIALFVRRAVIDGQQRREADDMRDSILSAMPAETQAALPGTMQWNAAPLCSLARTIPSGAVFPDVAIAEAQPPASADAINVYTDNRKQAGMGTFTPLSAAPAQPDDTYDDNIIDNIIIKDKQLILPEMRRAQDYGADVVGILMAGEDIDLYVVQGTDNDYYLTHNAKGEPSRSGAAFLDARCQLSPRSTHIMIHGHNMKSGVIFGNLDDFRDAEYLKEYPIVHFTTLYEREVYVPYAIGEISVDPGNTNYVDMPEWDFETDELFTQFVDTLRAHSVHELPIDVQPGDELLSLVTCSYNYDDGRFVVALRKLRDDETEDAMARLIRDSL